MQIEIIYTCGECGEYLSDIHVEHEVCPSCADHCTVVREEIVASPVCGG
jgi:DNA-directed RNA polymerase subunit RPC12/RpoP